MLELKISARDAVNEITCEFIPIRETTLHLEHSLISISKWESKWHKPFLNGDKHTVVEMQDYVRCMCLDSRVDPIYFKVLTSYEIKKILDYIDDPMTGTTFGQTDDNGDSQIMSSELLYYYMFANDIPIECEKWHLNRLLTLLRICGVKNKEAQSGAKPKQSQSQLLQKYASRHAARKKANK